VYEPPTYLKIVYTKRANNSGIACTESFDTWQGQKVASYLNVHHITYFYKLYGKPVNPSCRKVMPVFGEQDVFRERT
jgi:hypothetical protein